MPFTYTRIVHFQDTDAAGVVYFTNVLAICHEAYESSLVASGINLKLFFKNSAVAIPIVHASVDFFRPMFCGDQLMIDLTPKQLSDEKFEITYQVVAEVAKAVTAKALTKHVCINPASRTPTQLSAEIMQWLHQMAEP